MDAILKRKRTGSITRRTLMQSLVGLAGSGISTKPSPAGETTIAPSEGLRAHAERRGLLFGCAVQKRLLDENAELKAAVIREVGILVAENEMKWRPLQPEARPVDYRRADAIVDFSKMNGMTMRGHTAVWHQNPPVWAEALLTGPGGAKLMLDHVRTVVGHFKGRILEWDVVNEAIEPTDDRDDLLRAWPLYEKGGYDFIADCFHAAHEADPNARLVYNDYDLEYDTRPQALRRKGTLRLLGELKRRNAPIHGLGIQSHLTIGNRFNDRVFRQFLAEVAGMDLRITLTEMDLSDRRLEGSTRYRDEKVAEAASQFLSVAFDEPSTTGVLTWGLSDRFSWLNEGRPRSDRGIQRSLPLDENYVRKPVWAAMAACFDNAPPRR
ncbi:hypothetical protein ASG54_23205 [Aureimonas sp. Leaf460]|nr:hypothetical protein ASG62_23935 [Aureimonas sp. Leaf427]KQT62219.1 hypothetical protein ASG54_23205 [Aureimonas sp. Leaf460]